MCSCHSLRIFDGQDELNEAKSVSKTDIVLIVDVPLACGSRRRAGGAAQRGHEAGMHEGWNREVSVSASASDPASYLSST